jgi:hypothetical protein
MKSFSGLILCIILVALAPTVLAEENEYSATDNEELFGKWYLVDYTDGTPPQMVILGPGSWNGYYSVDDEEPGWKANNLITHKWTDAKGNIWYKTQWRVIHFHRGFSLFKISDSGKILEHIYSEWEYPNEINNSNDNYRIYRRK